MGSRTEIGRSLAVLAALGPACEPDLPGIDPVRGDAYPCAAASDDEVAFCGHPPTIVQTAPGPAPGSHVVFAGLADGTLLRIAAVPTAGELEAESRRISTRLGPLDRLLSCDVDGSGVPELILNREDALDPGFLLWDGQLVDDPARGGLVPVGPLWRADCVDVDGDGYADIAGIDDDAALRWYAGGPNGFSEASQQIPLGFTPVEAFTRAVMTRVDGCPAVHLAYLDYRIEPGAQSLEGVDGIALLQIDAVASAVVESTLLGLDSEDRSVRDFRLFALDGGESVLAVVRRDRDDANPMHFRGETLELYAGQDCGAPLTPVGSFAFSQIRDVRQRLDTPSQLVVVGSENDGVALLHVDATEPPSMIQSWDIRAIRADIVRFDAADPSYLVVSLAWDPYLELLAL